MADFSASGLICFILIIVFTVICGIFLLLRLWAAKISGRSFYPDDGFILFAYANCIALGGVGLWAALNGLGKSLVDLTKEEIAISAKLVMASNVCWLLASVFVKMSILWLLYRIFAVQPFRRWCMALMTINACYGVSFLPVYMTNCTPVDQLWNPHPGGHCRDMQISDFGTIGINLFLDLAILLLPLPTLWGLQLPRRKKIVATIMFSFGVATIGFMIWRIKATITTRADPDFTKHGALIGTISFFELWFGIIVACIPTLAPLFKTYVKPMVTKSKTSSASSGPYALAGLRSKNRNVRTKYDVIYGSSDLTNTETQSEENMGPCLAVTTEIASAPAYYPGPQSTLGANVIHVRSDIESQQGLSERGM
ncbi:hypothetical protein PT974_07435 [Cladobotryum mycophilum]|uniref:Rhodopsin domain-containing protein n=1 Tax=Cladobotryum mycophilum TaxID=491253 RepID=A0ABR0SQK0_9HYPO